MIARLDRHGSKQRYLRSTGISAFDMRELLVIFNRKSEKNLLLFDMDFSGGIAILFAWESSHKNP